MVLLKFFEVLHVFTRFQKFFDVSKPKKCSGRVDYFVGETQKPYQATATTHGGLSDIMSITGHKCHSDMNHKSEDFSIFDK